MKLELFRTLWGIPEVVQRPADAMKSVGYVGVEARVPTTSLGCQALAKWLDGEGLEYIGIVFTGGDVVPDQSASIEDHISYLARQLDLAEQLPIRFINVLAGNDRWPLARQVDFFSQAMQLADERAMQLSFETHRATSLYSPWVTLELIEQLPDLRFTSDVSHWVLVSERLLSDPLDDFSEFIKRVHHVQARVGYPQGPQVPHPGAPEYQEALLFHQQFWKSIWQVQFRAGYSLSTMTTEFGPDGYLHHLPFTNAPVADLSELNDWMAIEEQRHFEQVSQLFTS
ncbi:MAG: hypothetical protein CENE_02348 [Candidatus Celerinatantimonas neptuna]|nr:MAG: hypothetical protein CENE_02348 [Candidatus Celerinatantimonas neptuna]